MKKLGLCLMLCFLFLGNLAAQWSVGGKVGVDWSRNVYTGAYPNTSFKAGLNLGFVGNYQLNDWLDLQGELLYAQHNYADKDLYEMSEDGSTLNKGLKSHGHYLDIPLMVKFYPFRHDVGFNVEAGVQPGFFLGESLKIGDKSMDELKGERNPVDCSIVIGTSYHARKNWFVDLRYALGVTNIYKGYENVNADGIHIQSLQLSLGYLFQL